MPEEQSKTAGSATEEIKCKIHTGAGDERNTSQNGLCEGKRNKER